MLFFSHRNKTPYRGNFRKTFLFGNGGKGGIEFCVLFMLSCSGSKKVFNRTYPGITPEP